MDLDYRDGDVSGSVFFLDSAHARQVLPKLNATPLMAIDPSAAPDPASGQPVATRTQMTVMMDAERLLRKERGTTNKRTCGSFTQHCLHTASSF